MSSDLDVATIPPGPGLRHPKRRGVVFLVLAAAMLLFTVELADPNFIGSRRTRLLELLPVWFRVPLVLFVAVLMLAKARTSFRLAQSGWVLVISTVGVAVPTTFGWKTFEWSAFDAMTVDAGEKAIIRLSFAKRTLLAWLTWGGRRTLKLRQVNYETPVPEIARMIERRCPRLRTTPA